MAEAMLNTLVKLIIMITVVVVVTVSILMIWKSFVEPALDQIGGGGLFGPIKV